jgi:ABC-type uncharacterized transport system permease subunit
VDELLDSGLRLATPLACAALGGVIAERSGVFNIGLEGAILSGAFGAAAGAAATGSPWAAVVFGLLTGAAFGIILATLTVTLRINQFVSGFAVNLLAAGLTAFLARAVAVGAAGSALPGFGPIAPGLQLVPGLGPLVFAQDWMSLVTFVTPLFLGALLYRTRWGLEVRAVGESPQAADTAGVAVNKVRFQAVVGSSLLASFGGCHLVLAQVHVFTEGMSAGRGFIALAAVILGRWTFWGAFAACVLFGLSEALQLRLQFQNSDAPYQLLATLPYGVALVALVVVGKSSRAPTAAGESFERSSR